VVSEFYILVIIKLHVASWKGCYIGHCSNKVLHKIVDISSLNDMLLEDLVRYLKPLP